MEKLDKILTSYIESNKTYSKDFYEFVEDRNKDVHLYDDFLKKGNKGIEVFKVSTVFDIPGFVQCTLSMFLIFLLLALGYYGMWTVGKILLIPCMVYVVYSMVLLASAVTVPLGVSLISKTLPKSITILYILSGTYTYDRYKSGYGCDKMAKVSH